MKALSDHICRIAFFKLLKIRKIDFTNNLSDRKIMIFSRCPMQVLKFKLFSVIRILREINLTDFRISKLTVVLRKNQQFFRQINGFTKEVTKELFLRRMIQNSNAITQKKKKKKK